MAVITGINFLPETDMSPPMTWHKYREDFDLFLGTSWVITGVGSSPTQAISQAKDGILLITNTSADNDSCFLQARDVASGQVAEHWVFTAGKRFYFGSRFKVSDATQIDLVMGLQITDTTPLAVSDGIWFQKDDDDTHLDFHVAASSTQSDLTDFAELVTDTYTVLEFYYDGVTAMIQAFKDGVAVGALPLTNASTHTLALSFGIQNGEGAAKTMSIDWINIVQERG